MATKTKTKSLTIEGLNYCSSDIKFGSIVNLTSSTNKIKSPKISYYDNRDFVVVWKAISDDTINLVAQTFNSSYSKIDNQIDVVTHPYIGHIEINTFKNTKDFLVSWSTLATAMSNWQIHHKYYAYAANNTYGVVYDFDSLEAIKDTKGKFSIAQYNNSHNLFVSSVTSSKSAQTNHYDVTEAGANSIHNITESTCISGRHLNIVSAASSTDMLTVAWSTKGNVYVQYYDINTHTKIGSLINIVTEPLALFIDMLQNITVIGWQTSGHECSLLPLEEQNKYYRVQVFSNGQQISNFISISNRSSMELQQLYLINNNTFSTTFIEEDHYIVNIFSVDGKFITTAYEHLEINDTVSNITTAPTLPQNREAQVQEFAGPVIPTMALSSPFITSTLQTSFSNTFAVLPYILLVTTLRITSATSLYLALGNNKEDTCYKSCDERRSELQQRATLSSNIDQTMATGIIEFLNDPKGCGDLTLDYSTQVDITSGIEWFSDNSLTIKSKHNITFADNVIMKNTGAATIKLMAGIESDDHTATVNFVDTANIQTNCGGTITLSSYLITTKTYCQSEFEKKIETTFNNLGSGMMFDIYCFRGDLEKIKTLSIQLNQGLVTNCIQYVVGSSIALQKEKLAIFDYFINMGYSLQGSQEGLLVKAVLAENSAVVMYLIKNGISAMESNGYAVTLALYKQLYTISAMLFANGAIITQDMLDDMDMLGVNNTQCISYFADVQNMSGLLQEFNTTTQQDILTSFAYNNQSSLCHI